jgi:DNA primase
MLSPIEEIKNKLDIIEVLSGYIKLQKAGRNWRALCPFHQEKTPSFMVSPERQIWHCFGCSKGGDIFSFVKEIEGLDFSETLKLLAQRAGVILKKQDPKLRTEKQRLFEICELAAKFFEKQLQASQAGKEIEKYLTERGIQNETIRNWRLGFAPDDWRALSKFLKTKGYSDGEIIKSGVVVEPEKKIGMQSLKSSYYDRFRNRIIFPISDINSQVVGFAGRVAPGGDEKSAKYINTPQSLIYDKSRLLYGLDKGKLDIKTKNFCVIVEGNTDVIMSHQAGAKNTVASSGTALTVDHLKIIKRYTDNIVLAFDLDAAGDSATKRTIDLAIIEGFNVRIISTPEDKSKAKIDPADIIKKDPHRWLDIIAKAQGIVEFYFANFFSRHNAKDVAGKKEIAKNLLPLLKKIPNKIEQAHWVQELANRLSVHEKFLNDALRSVGTAGERKSSNAAKENKPQNSRTREQVLEEELFALLVCSKDVKAFLLDLDALIKCCGVETFFSDEGLAKIITELKKCVKKLKKGESFVLSDWLKRLPENQRVKANEIIFQLETKQGAKDILYKQIINCAVELMTEQNKKQRQELQKELKQAEREKDEKKHKNLLKKFAKLAKQGEEIKHYLDNK